MKSFLYILKHRSQPSFKIGKANDIWTRLKCIGGAEAFDIGSSHCIQFDTVDAAYRAERLLHRLFDGFLFGIDESNRYDGDTEHFKIECWDRVIACCKDNADLIGGALSDVPAAPVKAPELNVKPQKTVKKKSEMPLETFYSWWNEHVGMLEDLHKFDRCLKDYPCGIYEDSHGKYLLLGSGCSPLDGGDIRLPFLLQGRRFGTSFCNLYSSDPYILGMLIQSPSDYLNKVERALPYLDEADAFYQLKAERLMLAGSVVSSLPIWGTGEVKEYLWDIGYLNSQNLDDKQINDLLMFLRYGPSSITSERYQALCNVCSQLKPPATMFTASSACSDVRVFGSVAHIGNVSISRTLNA